MIIKEKFELDELNKYAFDLHEYNWGEKDYLEFIRSQDNLKAFADIRQKIRKYNLYRKEHSPVEFTTILGETYIAKIEKYGIYIYKK